MNGFQIGKIAGIPIRLNISLPVLIGVVFWVSAAQSGMAAGLNSLAVLIGIFASIALHELAHSLVTLNLGIKVRSITLFIFGGIAQLDRSPTKAREEILISVVGPPINFGLAGLILLARLAVLSRPLHELGGDVWLAIAAANITIGLFNCLPAFPLDGGRVLRALLWLASDFLTATRVVNVISKVLIIGIGAAFLLLEGLQAWMILLVLAFLWVVGSAEVRMAEVRAWMERTPVTQATITGCPLLSPYDPVGVGAQYLEAGFWCDQPVVQEGRLVGLLRRAALADPSVRPDPRTAVQQVMDPNFLWLDGSETLAVAEEALARHQTTGAAVFVERQLLGIVTPESIRAYMMSVLRGTPGRA
jgi:Zn-dependent protease